MPSKHAILVGLLLGNTIVRCSRLTATPLFFISYTFQKIFSSSQSYILSCLCSQQKYKKLKTKRRLIFLCYGCYECRLFHLPLLAKVLRPSETLWAGEYDAPINQYK